MKRLVQNPPQSSSPQSTQRHLHAPPRRQQRREARAGGRRETDGVDAVLTLRSVTMETCEWKESANSGT